MGQNKLGRYEQRLKTYYSETSSGENREYITKQQVKKWLMIVMNDKQIARGLDIISDLKLKIEQMFQQFFEEYLQEVVGLQTQKVAKVEFKYEQCVQFLSWLIDRQKNEAKQYNQNVVLVDEKQNRKNQDKQQYDQGQQLQPEHQEDQQQQEQMEQNHQVKQMQQNHSDKIPKQMSLEHGVERLKQQQKLDDKEQEEHDREGQENRQQDQNEVQKQQEYQQQQHGKQNQISGNSIKHSLNIQQKHSPSTTNQLTQPDERYKQYLETIFEHYCKVNYGLSKDNTFENMQKHISVMTINKFMIFANQFELPLLIAASVPKQKKQKPNKIQLRNLLMDVFKKSSQFHKQMNLDQFYLALNKIGQIAFEQMKIHEYTQTQPKKTQFSYEMIKMIKYLEISNFKEFKQKMTKLNINFSLKFNKLLNEKKAPINYKFKYDPNQNKPTQQVHKPPLRERKQSQKQENQHNFKKPKPLLQIAKPYQKPFPPNMPKIPNQNKSISERKGGSTKILPSQLNALNLNQRKERNIIPFQNSNKNSKSVEKLSHAPQPVIEGYANIHLAKKGLLSIDQSKNSTGAIRKKGDFQLNNVIEEARKQAQTKVYYDYQDSRSGRALSNLSRSKPMSHYSRDPVSHQSHRINEGREDVEIDVDQNDGNGRYYKMSYSNPQGQQLQRSRVDPHDQLKNLIDFNESDEDEYLDQHLKKEIDNSTEMGMRVEKKITQFNYKH